jgi:hypothetical protein
MPIGKAQSLVSGSPKELISRHKKRGATCCNAATRPRARKRFKELGREIK